MGGLLTGRDDAPTTLSLPVPALSARGLLSFLGGRLEQFDVV
jgi:hypothetical protein